MRKITERGESLGLLELEAPNDLPRPRRQVETAHIPDPVLEDPANAEASEPFLRTRQRVPVRRRSGFRFASRFGWNNRWVRIVIALAAFAGCCIVAAAVLGMKSLLLHNPRFLLASTDNIQVTGNRVVNTQQVRSFFNPDVNHSVFHAPLAKRQAELQQIQWVRRAAVMRLWPDRIRVNVVERMPIAFARDGNGVRLIDDDGVLLDLPNAAAQHYSFPVLNGVSSVEPLSVRAAHMDLYRQFVHALDAEGGTISASLSEIDLSDPEDVRAMFSDGSRQPLIHFGDKDFLARYRAYREHLKEWLQQYPNLQSVDMRYGRQVVLDTGSIPQQPSAPMKLTEIPAEMHNSFADVPPKDIKAAAAMKKTKEKTGVQPSSKNLVAKHPQTKHKMTHKHQPTKPERGHPVRDPIMHTVT